MVGTAIGYSIERILREHSILMNGLKFGVIGYGKIGRSVAKTARNSQAFVLVNDIDSVRLTHAYSHGYNTRVSSELISQSDILCVAAGKVSLKDEDFKNIKNGCWIFSVTSSDDSLDIEWIDNHYSKEQVSEYVCRYYKDTHYFYVVNGGNTINFIHGTTVGDFILLVQAELLVSSSRLLSGKYDNGLQELDKESRESICSIWLKHFTQT
jgi:adenosylhomocysteinase